jgi:Flp pilus assembly pilin Flp
MIRLQLLTWWNMFQATAGREEGQDLVEYALIIALACLAVTAGMSTLAHDIDASLK